MNIPPVTRVFRKNPTQNIANLKLDTKYTPNMLEVLLVTKYFSRVGVNIIAIGHFECLNNKLILKLAANFDVSFIYIYIPSAKRYLTDT